MSWSKIKNKLGKCLPVSFKNRIRRWRNRRDALRHKAIKDANIAQYGTFNVEELITVLRDSWVKEGGVLFVHCSFNDMHTFDGSPMDILKALRTLVGPSGTLLMPAYTTNSWSDPPRIFNVTREPTYTGVVNEMFRRTPGVIRSLHPRHSICGLGPLAEGMLSGHEKCIRANGPDSPFDRLRKRSDAYILTLGLPPGYISFLHWVDDYDPGKLPFNVHKTTPIKCHVIDYHGHEIEVADWQVADNVAAKLDYVSITKHLTTSAISFWQLKGTNIGLYPVARLAEELLSLRDKGIFHYR